MDEKPQYTDMKSFKRRVKVGDDILLFAEDCSYGGGVALDMRPIVPYPAKIEEHEGKRKVWVTGPRDYKHGEYVPIARIEKTCEGYTILPKK